MVKKLERKGIPIPEGATIKQLKDLDKTVKGQSGRPKKINERSTICTQVKVENNLGY